MTKSSAVRTKKTHVEKIREAEQVRDRLKETLRDSGVVLPSLGVDAAGYCDEYPTSLIDLGRCNIETANKLSDALERAKGEERK